MNDRRKLLKTSALAALGAGLYGVAPFYGPWKTNRAWAQSAQKKPLVIGLTMDSSGQYAASGADERLGAMMAIKEFNAKGGVLGRQIEAIHMDTETTPATGTRIAERMITRNEAAFLVGAVHSGVANAISQVAQKYGCVYLNTNSSSPTEAGKDCHRVKFVWDGNGTNFSHAIVKNAMKVNGKNWLLLTNDYVWGHTTSKATRAIIEANGGKVVDELLVPQNTRDFASYLLKIQQIKPDVVATAVGGDDIKALRQQVVQSKMNMKPAWINNQQDWPDVYGLGPDAIFGVFGTNWYWKLDLPGVKEFVAAYQKQYPGRRHPDPGQRLLQRLHGDARALARGRARRHDQQPEGDHRAREPEGFGQGPDAELRRLHEPCHAPVAADDLHGELQRPPEREGRHLQDPGPGAAAGRRGQGRGRSVQARNAGVDAELRAVSRGDPAPERDATRTSAT